MYHTCCHTYILNMCYILNMLHHATCGSPLREDQHLAMLTQGPLREDQCLMTCPINRDPMPHVCVILTKRGPTSCNTPHQERTNALQHTPLREDQRHATCSTKRGPMLPSPLSKDQYHKRTHKEGDNACRST
jgi:hypothetical protein